jgi:cell division protein FtsW
MKARYFFLIAAVVLLVIVFIPGVGVELNGSSRWIRFGPLPSIQPSEIAKFAMIIFTASTIYVNRNRMNTFRYGIMPNLLVLGVFCVLLFLQPNYSSIILMCILVFVMMFVGGAKGWHLAALGGAGGLAGFGLMLTEDYRIDRLLSFTDPWKYASDGGFQVIQSLYGIGAGGIMGRGLGNGRQKYLWLPYSESDFIFSITTEELGLIGAVILIVLYIILVYRGIKIAANAPDMFGTMLATGITTVIGMQVIINIGVVTASIPATGVPLPFLSYGNWSLMIMLCMVGILLSISRQTRRIKMAEERAGAMETGY